MVQDHRVKVNKKADRFTTVLMVQYTWPRYRCNARRKSYRSRTVQSMRPPTQFWSASAHPQLRVSKIAWTTWSSLSHLQKYEHGKRHFWHRKVEGCFRSRGFRNCELRVWSGFTARGSFYQTWFCVGKYTKMKCRLTTMKGVLQKVAYHHCCWLPYFIHLMADAITARWRSFAFVLVRDSESNFDIGGFST